MGTSNTLAREDIIDKIRIGFKFISMGKRNDITTIIDILTTFNSKGDIVKIEYQCIHTFLGQTVFHTENETTILRAVWDKGFVND